MFTKPPILKQQSHTQEDQGAININKGSRMQQFCLQGKNERRKEKKSLTI